MSDTTFQTPQTVGTEGSSPSRAADRGAGSQPFLRRYTWWLVALVIVVVAAAMLRWANTRPGYDPYGWLDWGYQTLRGSLDLGGAPSWKPFTYIFDVPYALLGHWALYVWMETAVAISLAGAVFAGRIAYRLTGADREHRWAGIVAAIFAGAAVLGIQSYFHYVLSVQSDPMLVTFCLAAIDMWMCGRLGWAWWLGVIAGLGRPEVWPFLAVSGVWLVIKRPSMRWMVFAGAVITLFMWFGIPEITNGKPDIAGQLALKSPRELHNNKIIGTLDRFTSLNYLPLELAALVAVGLAVLRRNLTVVLLAVMAAGWVVVEVAFVLHGFPGVPRYVFEPAAVTGVLGGVAVGWLLLDVSKIHRAVPRWAGIPLVVVLVAVMVPQGISEARAEHKDISHERARTKEINKLGATINALGGWHRVLACGHPVLNVEYVSIFAWYVHLNTGVIGYRPQLELPQPHPVILFTSLPNGWAVTPYHVPSGSSCARMRSLYVPTARHPGGVLVRR